MPTARSSLGLRVPREVVENIVSPLYTGLVDK